MPKLKAKTWSDLVRDNLIVQSLNDNAKLSLQERLSMLESLRLCNGFTLSAPELSQPLLLNFLRGYLAYARAHSYTNETQTAFSAIRIHQHELEEARKSPGHETLEAGIHLMALKAPEGQN